MLYCTYICAERLEHVVAVRVLQQPESYYMLYLIDTTWYWPLELKQMTTNLKNNMKSETQKQHKNMLGSIYAIFVGYLCLVIGPVLNATNASSMYGMSDWHSSAATNGASILYSGDCLSWVDAVRAGSVTAAPSSVQSVSETQNVQSGWAGSL